MILMIKNHWFVLVVEILLLPFVQFYGGAVAYSSVFILLNLCINDQYYAYCVERVANLG